MDLSSVFTALAGACDGVWEKMCALCGVCFVVVMFEYVCDVW